MRPTRILLPCALAFSFACSNEETIPDVGSPTTDAGPSSAADALSTADGGTAPDARSDQDTGPGADVSTSNPDAGPSADATSSDGGGQGADGSVAASIDAGTSTTGFNLTVIAQYTDVAHDLLYAQGHVYSVDYSTDNVYAFDANTAQLVATIPTGGPGPSNLAADENYLFVVNRMAVEPAHAYLSVIDTRTQMVTRRLTTSTKMQGNDPDNYPTTQVPWAAAVLDGFIYVTFPTNAEPDVIPIEIASFREDLFWNAGSGPSDLIGQSGRLFVIQGRGIFDPNDDAITAYQPNGDEVMTFETGGRLIDIVASAGKVFVSRAISGQPGEILVIDADELNLRRITVSQRPYGLAVANARVYVMAQDAKKIDVIHEATEMVVESIDLSRFPVLVNPRALAVTPAGKIFIESDGMISVLTRVP